MPEMVSAPELCEMEGCTKRAVGEVNAWWTIADFVMYLTCATHVWEMYEGLCQRPIEGQVPSDVWVKWFDGSTDQR